MDGEDHEEELKVPMTIVVKLSDSSLSDLWLNIDNILTCSVSEMRRLIRQKVAGITVNRRLRLIHGGKVLNDHTNVARDVAGIELSKDNKTIEKQPRAPRVYVHCAIGDILSPSELAKEGEYDKRIPARSTLPELRGFDRLRDTGFTDEDIVQLRQQFGRLYGYGTTGFNEAAREDLTRMEEQWIETGVADGPPDAAALIGGDYLDDLVGILIGMFLGVFILLLLKEATALFSKRQQKALVAGAAVNFSFALLKILM
jgi:hypothetical protein